MAIERGGGWAHGVRTRRAHAGAPNLSKCTSCQLLISAPPYNTSRPHHRFSIPLEEPGYEVRPIALRLAADLQLPQNYVK